MCLDTVGHAELGIAIHFYFDGEISAFTDANSVEVEGKDITILAGEGDAAVDEIEEGVEGDFDEWGVGGDGAVVAVVDEVGVVEAAAEEGGGDVHFEKGAIDHRFHREIHLHGIKKNGEINWYGIFAGLPVGVDGDDINYVIASVCFDEIVAR